MADFKFFTQISTSHSSEENLNAQTVRARLHETMPVLPMSGLIVGSYENKAVFNELSVNKCTDDPEVYLWYNLLSDYKGQDEGESVVTIKGNRCKKWFGWGDEAKDEVKESFMFSCPNNPVTRQKTLTALSDLLDRYPFDGVFLDKFRFPSPASGLELTLTCFCPHCRAKAAEAGLDLDEVKAELKTLNRAGFGVSDRTDNWLEAILNGKPLLKRWMRFRIDSVLDIVKETKSLVNSKGMRLGLDLFSPAFAEVVGYDLTDLSKLADWVKPMTYQFAMGPAGLRLETSALIDGLSSEFGLSKDRIFEICRENIPWFTPEKYQLLKEKEVPMEWIESEMRVSVQKMTGTPVYFGIECVSFPGVIDVHPEQAAALVQAAMNAGGDGAVLSWDLMHMPVENLRAMRKVYDESRS